MQGEQPDYEIELSALMPEAELETMPEVEKMKALWYIEQNPEKKDERGRMFETKRN